MILPRHPVYVISKGRANTCLTARFLERDRVPFHVVVEPQEADAYAANIKRERLLMLPFSNLGLGGVPARNWVWEHARSAGAERHWILDDNIRRIRRRFGGKRIPCSAGPALAAVEDFADRYENLAIAGLNYSMFGFMPGSGRLPPFYLNCRVYSTLLIRCDLPMRWRGRYNEDADLCLQVIAGGMCTALINVFLAEKMATMTMKGGNAAELYRGDGRLKMARSLERMWPHVVTVSRRFGRPQHQVRGNWTRFDTPLRLKQGVAIPSEPNEYGLELVAVPEKIK